MIAECRLCIGVQLSVVFTSRPLFPIRNQQSAIRNLLALLMARVLPAEPAVLAHLEPIGRLLLVLRRAVVAPFALQTRQSDDISHGCIPRNW
jgi:hypothetical protein